MIYRRLRNSFKIKNEPNIENWKEYIDQKFQPLEDFEIKEQEDSSTIDLKHIRTGTIVSFIWPDDEWKRVSDIQYWNKKTQGWSGEFGDVEFNEENRKKVDKFLDSVFETGWSSKDIYLFGKHYKSIVFDQPNFEGHKFTFWSSYFGCLTLIFFPLFLVFGLLIRIGILGKVKKIEIQPIKKITTPQQWL